MMPVGQDSLDWKKISEMKDTSLDRQGQVRTLGKLVNQNEACSFCHTPETGFTGPLQSLNLTTVSYPGSVRSRFSNRKPQSYMYAPFVPVLHYNALQGDFVGGNFWDIRAKQTDFGINPPGKAGVRAKDEVKIAFDVRLSS